MVTEEIQQSSVRVSRTDYAYRLLDRTTGFLALAMIISSPWLFGTTEDWSIRLMNACAYALGGLFVALRLLRPRLGGSVPPGAWLTRSVAALTAFLLLFIAVSAFNARATYFAEEHRFEYHDYLSWLPFSYDRERTWELFWTYLGFACFFWSLRDWLLYDPSGSVATSHPLDSTPRLRLLCWTVSINTAVLCLVGIFQRLTGTGHLLWLRESWFGTSESMFATYSYRGNAAQLLNLVWPLTLGFWWTLREQAKHAATSGARIGSGAHLMLLPCTIIMAAGPIIASSRGGTLIGTGLLVSASIIFFSNRRVNWRGRCLILFLVGAVFGLGGYLGWEQLRPELAALFNLQYVNPIEIYENAEQMAVDFPAYGIGPGAFPALYPLYRTDTSQPWHMFLHDDWLQTRVTFGWVGSLIILCMLALALARWFVPGGIACLWEFVALIWMSLAGCLIHAKFSFPLQIYSVLQLFLVLCCILLCVSRPEKPGASP